MSIKLVKTVVPLYPFESYMHEIAPLTADEGGGFAITFPDLPGCMSDGETIEETIQNGREAFEAWVAAVTDLKRPVPPPTARPAELVDVSGRFVTRLPKTLHARLQSRARVEGVSINSLAISYIAEGLARKAA
ncbi:MAG: type II toxin-antitoxin system HicB family antitoxin [Deltaproteobacteria bacterium]|jgi:predicted RNase H-like HicB family nuclease